MASYLGLSGPTLRHAILWLIVCPSFMCYGYNLSVAGGLLTLESFVSVFPQLDTLNTKGDEQRYNSTIQGMLYIVSRGVTLTTGGLLSLFLPFLRYQNIY